MEQHCGTVGSELGMIDVGVALRPARAERDAKFGPVAVAQIDIAVPDHAAAGQIGVALERSEAAALRRGITVAGRLRPRDVGREQRHHPGVEVLLEDIARAVGAAGDEVGRQALEGHAVPVGGEMRVEAVPVRLRAIGCG